MEVRQVAAWRKDALGFADILRALVDGYKEINRVAGLKGTLNVSLGEGGKKSQAKEKK